MNKFSILIPTLLLALLLPSCNNPYNPSSSSENLTSSSEVITSNSSENLTSNSEEVITSSEDYTSEQIFVPSLYELFYDLKILNNYTLEIEDQIFGVTTTYEYLANAMYYTPSKEAHGGTPIGYAQSQNNEIFTYVINNDELEVGPAVSDNNGNLYTDLYGQVQLSLRDLDLDNLVNIKSDDNKYVIDAEKDPYNFLVFVALAGYYDQFALPYLSLEIEVTGQLSFISKIYFDTGNEETSGYIVMTIKDINSTEIPLIDDYIKSGGGPKIDESSSITDYLKIVKESRNYKVEVKGESTHFIDIYNEEYYYSHDLINESNSLGYVLLEDSYIYKFNKNSDEIVLLDEIYYETENHNDIWGNIIAKRSFASLNLHSNMFKLTYTSSGYVLENSYSALSILLSRCHVIDISGFAPVDTENDQVIFNLENDVLTYKYISATKGTYEVSISSLGTAKDENVEAFIEEYNNKEDVELDLLSTLSYLKANHNYTISYKENFSYTTNNILQKEDADIYFSENHYYFTSSERNLHYGYFKDDVSAYKYVVNNDVISKEKDLSSLDLSKNYKSFNEFDETKFTYSENNDGSYKVEDDTFLSLLASIASINVTNFLTYISSVSITLSQDLITIKGSSLMYGSCSFEIKNIGSTTLKDISL